MNRAEFQQLAEVRIEEAGVLLAAGKWDGAYYLAGYAVECALKACVLARVEREGVIFEDKKFSEKCWTHRFDELVDLAGLRAAWAVEVAANTKFAAYGIIAAGWKEDARYKRTPPPVAQELLDALSEPTNGVLRWIRLHW